MIKIKSKKIHNSPDNKSFTYYLTFENDPIEYQLNYNYSNSCFYKGVTATLSIVSNNFCKAISSKRLKFIKRFSIKQVHDIFDEYNLNKPKGEILLNQLYYKEVAWINLNFYQVLIH